MERLITWISILLIGLMIVLVLTLSRKPGIEERSPRVITISPESTRALFYDPSKVFGNTEPRLTLTSTPSAGAGGGDDECYEY